MRLVLAFLRLGNKYKLLCCWAGMPNLLFANKCISKNRTYVVLNLIQNRIGERYCDPEINSGRRDILKCTLVALNHVIKKPCHCLSTSINKVSKLYYLSFKVIIPVSDVLVLLCFHPDTVGQPTPL